MKQAALDEITGLQRRRKINLRLHFLGKLLLRIDTDLFPVIETLCRLTQTPP
jgi:hypothetical protein